MTRSLLPLYATAIALALLLPWAARAQAPLLPDELQLAEPAQCEALARKLEGREQGSQWLIGDNVQVYGLINARTPMQTLPRSYQRVTCYSAGSEGSGPVTPDRVFVAAGDGGFCGWVDREALIDEHRDRRLDLFAQRPGLICDTPRAMLFTTFCDRLKSLGATAEEGSCAGVPLGLRAKGVLIGATIESFAARFPFLTAPVGGEPRESRSFFSVLEIHDVASGGPGRTMALVGDGDGDVFGWIDLEALELWPTRLGLFYDVAGAGVMFQRQRDLVLNWREGTPPPDIQPQLGPDELRNYVHGSLPLLSYPIVRTIDPSRDFGGDLNDPSYHEVIVLGQTGEGSASELLAQAEFARRVEAVNDVNVMLVADTTESMRRYLPLIRDGVADFIRGYGQRSQNPANRLPNLRIGFYAYSDFAVAGKIGPNDRIVTEEVAGPTSLGPGFDTTQLLERVGAHAGLDDAIGLREEAALEAVAQLSANFESEPGWFPDGPRVIIHIADHGSRDQVRPDVILALLGDRRVHYFPVVVVTDDEKDASRTSARNAFLRQAVAMLRPIVDRPTEADVVRIDLQDFQRKTPVVVREQLDFVMDQVVRVIERTRGAVTGGLTTASTEAQDRASSRIRLDDALIRQYGLEPKDVQSQVIVQANTGFAPLHLGGLQLRRPIDWTYTLTLERAQANLLRAAFERMCSIAGNPRQSQEFRNVIVELARAFSGDAIETNAEVLTVLDELRNLPGAEGSFLAQPVQTLIQRAESVNDDAMVAELRLDVCWISYHLTNMNAGTYARPDQLAWSGREFSMRPGEQVVSRQYIYKPVIGAEAVYLPSFFFVRPSQVATEKGPCLFC